jgi:hypothetical protein
MVATMKPIILNMEQAEAIAQRGLNVLCRPALSLTCPFEDDDEMWVREAWDCALGPLGETETYLYRADLDEKDRCKVQWKPSIHMKATIARYGLKVIRWTRARLGMLDEFDAIRCGYRTLAHMRKVWDRYYKRRGLAWDPVLPIFFIAVRTFRLHEETDHE